MEGKPACIDHVPPRSEYNLAEEEIHVTFKIDRDALGEDPAEGLLSRRPRREGLAAY